MFRLFMRSITPTALVTKVMCSSSRLGRRLTCNREDQGRSGKISCSRWSQSGGVTDPEEELHYDEAHDGISAHLVADGVPEEGGEGVNQGLAARIAATNCLLYSASVTCEQGSWPAGDASHRADTVVYLGSGVCMCTCVKVHRFLSAKIYRCRAFIVVRNS